MITIIAGSKIQAEAWQKTQGLDDSEVTIITDYTQLVGAKDVKYVLIGTHYQRPDIMKLKIELARSYAKQLDTKTLKEMR